MTHQSCRVDSDRKRPSAFTPICFQRGSSPNKIPLIDCLATAFVEYRGSDLELICMLKTLINFD